MTLLERLNERWERMDGAAARKIDRILKERREAADVIGKLVNALEIAKQELTFHHIALPVIRGQIIDGALEAGMAKAQPLSEWHEDVGPVVWWWFARDTHPQEASWIGTPLDDDWPGYHTHWTAHPPIPSNYSQ